ncbi:MAG: TetR/AcrR family transcriptional regulator [Thermomicrobiales bacterium]|jgi:TetR/AcrR family transcriptional regulator
MEDTDRRRAILEAAFAEFSAKGFRGATIKSIARAAGIQSPALIYWYFPTKEALFQAVIEAHVPVLGMVVGGKLALDAPPEQVLETLAHALLATFNQPAEARMARLILTEAVQRPEIAHILIEHGPGRGLAFLTTYLARQVELGRLRPHDPRAGAVAFLGMFAPLLLSRVAMPALAEYVPDAEAHVRTVVDIFLCGLRVDDAEQERITP